MPPKGTDDWQRIAFQPRLYLGLWLGSVAALLGGLPAAFLDDRGFVEVWAWAWSVLSLASAPAALLSLWMVNSANGKWKYRGLWLRIAADIGQFTALVVYAAERITFGGLGPYPTAILMAVLVFVAHLVMRDMGRVHAVEKLARKITRGDV